MKKLIRLFLILSGSLLLILFLIPIVFIGIINAGNLAGILLSTGILLCGAYMERILGFFFEFCKKRHGKILTVILCLALCTAISLVIYSGICISAKFSVLPTEPTVAIVLGCKVNPDGPSLMLKSRIDAAYEFLKANPDTKCIVSGGKGNDEHMSEAQCMYDELTAMGIDEERIFIEDKSSNTRENLSYSLDIIKDNNLSQNVTIITNEFHQHRASQIASKLGLTSCHVSGPTPFWLFPTYFLREIGGVILELLF